MLLSDETGVAKFLLQCWTLRYRAREIGTASGIGQEKRLQGNVLMETVRGQAPQRD